MHSLNSPKSKGEKANENSVHGSSMYFVSHLTSCECLLITRKEEARLQHSHFYVCAHEQSKSRKRVRASSLSKNERLLLAALGASEENGPQGEHRLERLFQNIGFYNKLQQQQQCPQEEEKKRPDSS
mmetsp:Transcript_40500/g.75050  ORF Transcript_40500/g.75050 Transcript_40500/m.75050 type:complete len:127 (-) Transcript_40500:164-544(-)